MQVIERKIKGNKAVGTMRRESPPLVESGNPVSMKLFTMASFDDSFPKTYIQCPKISS